MGRTATASLTALFLTLLGVPGRAEKILFLGGGNSRVDSAVSSELSGAGNQVTIGPNVTSFTGAGLSAYNAVVMAPGMLPPVWKNNGPAVAADMPVSGQQALVNFVAAGGGLVTGGDTMLDHAQGGFQTLITALPFLPGSIWTSNNSIMFQVQTYDPVLLAHLPQYFTFLSTSAGFAPSEEYYQPKYGATSFFTTSQWSPTFGGETPSSGALGWTYGLGRVFSISTPIDFATLHDANFAQLVFNAVSWTTRNGSSPPVISPVVPAPIPEPAAVTLWGLGLALALAMRSRGRTRGGLSSRTPA